MSSDLGESNGSDEVDNETRLDVERDALDTDLRGVNTEYSVALTQDIVEEERERAQKELGARGNGASFVRLTPTTTGDIEEESVSRLAIPQLEHEGASADSASIPDDTPSIQGSAISSPGSSSSRLHRSSSLQPFERRFTSRLSPSPLGSPRLVSSPAFLSPRSRQSSVSSNIFQSQSDGIEAETPQAPWDVVRWTKLKKITGQVFSEVGRRTFGRPTCLCIGASIVIGTSRGCILVFDYQQVLKSIIGPGTKAVECGPVTALAISADHSTVAGGHATGYIFTWELSRPAKPFLQIPPLDRSRLDDTQTDGHVSGVSILHTGFLGTRHTALVSADDGGMAFAHLATRGLGMVGRTVKTTRILGRYPPSSRSLEKPRKPSSVLAFAPLPLGNIEQATDDMGVTALLTPYLLVIVSTTPVAQTHHKAARPKEIAPHSTLSGCLAWFPAVKLKNPSGDPPKAVSKTKLVYCWSNILTILDVDVVGGSQQKDKRAELDFNPRSRWRSEEAIVAVQWLSRSVLGVLTISQRLFILEDGSLRVTDTFDLLRKHIYHGDLFSRQLRPVVEQLDEGDASLHGVVADAFYMSFRAHKGRIFLLGFDDISIGTLSNWADRLFALMEDGDFITAIGLATSYYNGDADKLTVGLPEDNDARHALVQEKLLDMISASLKYTFSNTAAGEDSGSKEKLIADLADVCFIGCMSTKEMDFLFEDVYDAYEEGAAAHVFFETLEPYVLGDEISEVPPNVLKDLIAFYASSGRAVRLEEMICRLNTETMDINQVTILCQQYNLYDALIYVWTRAIGDFVTPLVTILTLIKMIVSPDNKGTADPQNIKSTSAMKIFPYLAYSFTGRIYPSGTFLDDSEAYGAKKDLYRFIFSGKTLEWPPGSGQVILTRNNTGPEPSFPYLRLILEFDTASFMSMLNEAFEDSFLNGEDVSSNDQVNGAQQGSALTPTRQYIVNILFGLMTEDNFDPGDVIYFYMFIARNLPKYPQHIILPGTSLHQILGGLCNYPSNAVKDDCQLSVEYLLSVYHPPDLQKLIPSFRSAGFYRVLKTVYRGSQQYAKLLEAYFDDNESRETTFDCIRDCLRPNRGISKKQVNEVRAVVVKRARELAGIDASLTAQLLRQYAPDLLQSVLDTLEPESRTRYNFLHSLIESENQQSGTSQYSGENLPSGFTEQYVQLMCKFNKTHVADFVSLLKSGDLELTPVLPALEDGGVIDAAVVLMARDGLVRDAMDRLRRHLGFLEKALIGLIKTSSNTPDARITEEAIQDLLDDVQKYCKVGIWLCQGQTREMDHLSRPQPDRRKSAYADVSEDDLALDELLWLDLVDTVVRLTKHVTAAATELTTTPPAIDNAASPKPIDSSKISTILRSAVQQTFSALLASTTTSVKSRSSSHPPHPNTVNRKSHQPHQNPSFLRILRTFLTRATISSPSLSDLRAVLSEIFDAYTFEETILGLANRFLDKDAFTHVEEVHTLRQQGWRPRGQVCEVCRKRAWGPGAGADIWEAWERKGEREVERRGRLRGGEEAVRKWERGKGRVDMREEELDEEDSGGRSPDGSVGGKKVTDASLVVFACRHLWHRKCLEGVLEKESTGGQGAIATNADRIGERGRLICPMCV